MKSQVTIKDIAKALNISKSTVSRALRDRFDINPETKKTVMEMAKKMDYRPNRVAQSLKKKKTFTLGVIIPSYQIPFYSNAISGIENEASSAGYSVLTCQSNETYEEELKNIEILLTNQVDGIIMSLSRETGDLNHVKKLIEQKVPIVLFNRVGHALEVSKVTVDDYHGAKNVVRHLAGIGKTRIAHIAGPLNLVLSRNRRKGYLDALREFNIKENSEFIVEGDFTLESGETCCKKLLSLPERPDAIFCVCDNMAFGAMKVIKQAGLKIPADIAIAGFTNEPVAPLVDPPLTTVAQPIFEIGQQAARLLFEQIENEGSEYKHVQLKTEVIIRESTVMK